MAVSLPLLPTSSLHTSVGTGPVTMSGGIFNCHKGGRTTGQLLANV